MSELKINGVSMQFGNFRALKNVNLEVSKGEFVTLLGPSGCGKTTLLNIISGFLSPTTGSVHIGSDDVTSNPPEHRDTAMCFQSYALFPHLNVEDNIAFGLRQKKSKQADALGKVEALLLQLNLTPNRKKLPNTLSGGQQQRVALARALAVAPGIVLFDEPLSNLDAKLRDSVRREIRLLQEEVGFTAIYVTHDQAEALAMSDRVFLMNKGEIEQAGSPRDIYFSPKTSFVADFIGAANIHRSKLNNGIMSTAFGELKVDDKSNGSAIVCWRPEFAGVGGSLSGRVTSTAFQGTHLDVFLNAGNEDIRLQLPGSQQIEVGSTLSFDVAPEHIVRLES